MFFAERLTHSGSRGRSNMMVTMLDAESSESSSRADQGSRLLRFHRRGWLLISLMQGGKDQGQVFAKQQQFADAKTMRQYCIDHMEMFLDPFKLDQWILVWYLCVTIP